MKWILSEPEDSSSAGRRLLFFVSFISRGLDLARPLRYIRRMILVTGGSGFVGSAVVRQLHAHGHAVRVMVRDPHHPRAMALQQATGCELISGSVLLPETLGAALYGIHTVIHLVGIIFERGDQTFERVHAAGTRHLIAACRDAGIRRFIHMSASGTRPHAISAYHRSKWDGECAVRESGLDWTIFRPAVIYGPGDGFCSMFVRVMTPPVRWLTLGVLPVIEGGGTLMQPVHVREVAAAFHRSLTSSTSRGKVYELAGPALPFVQLLHTLARHHGVSIHPVPVPRELAYLGAGLIEALSPIKMPTPGHVAMLEEDQHADTTPARDDLQFHAMAFEDGLKNKSREP
jgi:uncharacterized protein YbjT (DUF2867 family)